MKIWRLESNVGNRWLSVKIVDLLYFSSHFVTECLPDDWKSPDYEILGKSKKVPDYISWSTGAPLVTERFANELTPWVGEYIQLLPFGVIKKKKSMQ